VAIFFAHFSLLFNQKWDISPRNGSYLLLKKEKTLIFALEAAIQKAKQSYNKG